MVVRTYVNMDAANIFHPNKKRLLCDSLADRRPADGSTARGHDATPSLPRTTSPRPDFRQHLDVLWPSFLSSYSKTDGYWPAGCQLLVRRSDVLDLSLVALCVGRLAADSPGASDLLVLSLSAHNRSIGLYRRLMQAEHTGAGLKALLAVTSTIYAVMDASLLSAADIAAGGWGESGHFDGALSMIRQIGPSAFSSGGVHLVFKKIREMGVSMPPPPKRQVAC